MGNITLSFSNNTKKNNKIVANIKNKPENTKVILTYHDCIKEVPEYYAYINESGQECKFIDTTYTINKISSSQYLARKSFVAKIPLNYVEGKESIDYVPGYFTYNDNEQYLDKVNYNSYTNSYEGTLEIVHIYDKEILLFEE